MRLSLGIGAYTSALLSQGRHAVSLATLPLAMLVPAIFGVIVGLASLRVRADFLAITTMGVGFLFVGVVRQQDALGGEMGISAIPDTGLSKLAFMLLTPVPCACWRPCSASTSAAAGWASGVQRGC